MDICGLQQLFISERRYLKSVTPKTISWYRSSFKAFGTPLASIVDEGEIKPAIKTAIAALLERGVSPRSVNVYLGCINAFCKWLSDEEHIHQRIHVPLLKTEQKVLAILADEKVRSLIAFRPHRRNDRRAHLIALLILDTGLRADEALNIQKTDVDADNLLITVRKGKGQKQRIVPFSFQLRKVLYKHILSYSHPQSAYVFTTGSGTVVSQRNALRDLKSIGVKISVTGLRFHLLRHQFATNYLKTGGSVAFLRKVLGHSSIVTTCIYEHLATSDLSKEHHSILATT